MGYVFRTEDQQAAIDGLRRFLADKVEPIFNKEYRDTFIPKEKMGEVMAQLADFGIVSGMASEANGGLGIDWLTSTMLLEEVSAASTDLAFPVVLNSFGVQILEKIAPAHLYGVLAYPFMVDREDIVRHPSDIRRVLGQ